MLEAAERIAHGGDLASVRALFPSAPEPWIDLSTGINPIPYPVSELASDVWTRLPSAPALARLEAIAARRYGVDPPSAVVGAPGTQALIQLLPRLRPAGRVAVLGATYAEHALAWRREGDQVEIIPDLSRAGSYDAVVAVNPDNPTGRLVPLPDLLAIERELRAHGGLLAVDEAFLDLLEPAASLAPRVHGRSAVVLRSFGKTYGLAGLRLGFAVADAPITERLRGFLGPWAVSGPAIAIGSLALADDAWLAGERMRLGNAAARLDRLLRGAGFEVRGASPLFRFAEHRRAGEIFEQLCHSGIHVRRFAERPDALRFGLPGAAAQWRRLATALAADRSSNHDPPL
jgi:cobalamin biosynthetic protein CobC